MWSIFIALLGLVAVAAVALPWNAALGGVTSQVTDQVGAVVPGLLASAVLLGLFGLGFGTLVKNQVAAILLTIGGTLILEGILIALAKAIFHYDLNWLPNGAGAALAGDIARGFGGGNGHRGDPTPDLVAGRPGAVGLGPRAADPRLLHHVPPRRHLSCPTTGRRRTQPAVLSVVRAEVAAADLRPADRHDVLDQLDVDAPDSSRASSST